MTPNEYQNLAMKTCGQAEHNERLAMAAMGLAGETGECCDLVKKHLWHGHNLDVAKTQHELGDVLWYLTLLCDTLGVRLETVMEQNIEKLQKRYPDGFSHEASLQRID